MKSSKNLKRKASGKQTRSAKSKATEKAPRHRGDSKQQAVLDQLQGSEGTTAGRIDVVVVYKVDRLTRALADFAKIVEIFDQRGVSFVSVTQQFNTTSSMGRLTLNVLLSFAQFEREVTGERIRDKIAASKKKGLWMGGFVPLGYRPYKRTLIIHEPEAKVVRTIFQLYHQLGSVLKVEAELKRRGITRPLSTTMASKRAYGARLFMRGEIYKLLENPICIGEIQHKGQRYSGQHPPIVDRKLWNAVRAKLTANAHNRYIGRGIAEPSLLAGLLHDDRGNRLTPTHTVKKGKRYRYYALQRRHAGKTPPDSDKIEAALPRWRIPASEIETVVIAQLANLMADSHWLLENAAGRQAVTRRKAIIAEGKSIATRLQSLTGADLRVLLLSLVTRISLSDSGIRIDVDRSHLAGVTKDQAPQAQIHLAPDKKTGRINSSGKPCKVKTDDIIQIHVPLALGRRGLETKLIINAPGEEQSSRKPDHVLVKLISNAHRWWEDLMTGRYPTTRALAQAYGTDERYVARVVQLAFLTPSIVDMIVTGQQPIELTAQKLMTLRDLPHSWNTQKEELRRQ